MVEVEGGGVPQNLAIISRVVGYFSIKRGKRWCGLLGERFMFAFWSRFFQKGYGFYWWREKRRYNNKRKREMMIMPCLRLS